MCDKSVICYLLCIICYEISLQFVLHTTNLSIPFDTASYVMLSTKHFQAGKLVSW